MTREDRLREELSKLDPKTGARPLVRDLAVLLDGLNRAEQHPKEPTT